MSGGLHRQLNDPKKVKYWTDFTKVLLHEKAVYPLPGIWHGTSSIDGFTHGFELLTAESKEDLLDRARCLAEACESPQVYWLMHIKAKLQNTMPILFKEKILMDLSISMRMRQALQLNLMCSQHTPRCNAEAGKSQAAILSLHSCHVCRVSKF